MPVATASTACCTIAHAAPPPCGIRLKNDSDGTPSSRATAISALASMANVTMPSTSDGDRPASASAAREHSAASASSLRPESFENSVAPIPTIAALFTPPPGPSR